jgi:hypothetical protein
LRLKGPSSISPGKRIIIRCSAPPTPQSGEARKSACALSPRVSLRQRSDCVRIGVPRPSQRLELGGCQMMEPYPDATDWRPFRLNGDGAERQGRGEDAKASGVIVILIIAPIWEQAAPAARIVPAQGRFPTRGPRTLRGRIKGPPSRLGGPPGRFEQVPCQASTQVTPCKNMWRQLETRQEWLGNREPSGRATRDDRCQVGGEAIGLVALARPAVGQPRDRASAFIPSCDDVTPVEDC